MLYCRARVRVKSDLRSGMSDRTRRKPSTRKHFSKLRIVGLALVSLILVGCGNPEEPEIPPSLEELRRQNAERSAAYLSRHRAESAPLSPPSVSSAQRSSRPMTGENGYLSIGSGQIAVAVTEGAFDELLKVVRARDMMGLAQLLSSGDAFAVPNNTRVLVIEQGLFKTRVRIVEGEAAGRSGWVPMEFVQK